MSLLTRTTTVRGVAFACVLAGIGLWAIPPADAADVGAPVYGPGPGPAPYPPPNYGPVYGPGGPCHIVLDRRIDPYGREVVHRMRVCDEGPVYPGGPVYPSAVGPGPGPEYGYPQPRYYEPEPSGYGYPPRPPAPIGPGYYN